MFKEILASILAKEEVCVTFPNLKLHAAQMVEIESFSALQKIKAVIEDDSLDDFECIEKIVCVFESMGSSCGNRHDFG